MLIPRNRADGSCRVTETRSSVRQAFLLDHADFEEWLLAGLGHDRSSRRVR